MVKYQIGSKLLGIENCHDNDFLVISNEYNYKRCCIDGEDILYRSEENLKEYMEFKNDDYRNLIFNYQLDKDIIGQDFPIEYHILDYREQLVALLKMILEKKKFNFNKKITIKKLYCGSKRLYHIAYNMFICQNNSVILTSEQKEIVQKLHDCIMPISYLDEMGKIINSL